MLIFATFFANFIWKRSGMNAKDLEVNNGLGYGLVPYDIIKC